MRNSEITPLVDKLDAIAAEVSYLAARQRAQEELLAELTPIAREAMGVITERLDALDKQGAFEFASELAGVGRRVLEGFSAADVRQLGDAVVAILDTVRAMTQPEVLQVAAEAAEAVTDADEVKPLGIFGMVRATRNDDVQKGMALMVEVLRRVGRGAAALAERDQSKLDRKARLAELLGPRRGKKKVLGIERPQLPAAPNPATAAAPAAPAPQTTTIDGVDFAADGHLADPTQWTRELGEAIAAMQGVTLTDAHWNIIDTARAEFTESGASPNIRRLTQIAGVSTRDLYTLFPTAPGRTIAKIAGLPKPAGCL